MRRAALVRRLAAVAALAATHSAAARAVPAAGQDPEAEHEARVAWLRQALVPLRTIDPEDEDFADLEPLRAEIGAARVVALGEQSHGDGATFLAKHRLVRFLHQRLGFDVLLWESGTFDCRLAERELDAGHPALEAARAGVFPIFGESGQVLPLFEYASATRSTLRPLELGGIDCQLSGVGARDEVAPYLVAFFDALDPEVLRPRGGEDWSVALAELCAQVGSPEPEDGDSARAERRPVDSERGVLARLTGAIRTRRAELAVVHGEREIAFAERVLGNLAVLAEMTQRPQSGKPEDTNVRDRRMAENLVWLVNERYAGRKVIVWAASFHLMRNAPTIESARIDYSWTAPMGELAHALLREDYYAVAFTAHGGRAGNAFGSPVDLDPPSQGSLEHLLHDAGAPYAFLDLRSLPAGGEWLAAPLTARPLGYSEMRADWTQVFDALVFTDRMFPSTRDGAVPAGVRTAAAPVATPLGRSLARFRELLVGYGLGFDSVFPREAPKGFDPARLDALPEDAWPKVLGHVDPREASFQVLAGDEPPRTKSGTGAFAFTTPLTRALAFDGEHTLVFQDGVAAGGTVYSSSYGSLLCQGPMAGQVKFTSYATAYVDGDLSGSLSSSSYFNGVITGSLAGSLELGSYAQVYVLGGLSGSVQMKSSKLVLAGYVSSSALQLVHGSGTVWVELSDLPAGEHLINGVKVIVGPGFPMTPH